MDGTGQVVHIPPPDWEDSGGTGGWQIGYRLDDNNSLVFLRGGPGTIEPDPSRQLACYLLDHGTNTRNTDLEVRLLHAIAGVTEAVDIGSERFRTVREQQVSMIVQKVRNNYREEEA